MSLRPTILRHSLPLLPHHSFTRHTLALALSSLPPSHPAHRAQPVPHHAIDTLFGTGNVDPGQALVRAWDAEGRKHMVGEEGGVIEALGERLRWSAEVGEHLVEVSVVLRENRAQ